LGDLEAARALLESSGPVPPREAVVLAQQTAEKALKAVIVYRGGDPPRTHDVGALWRRVARDASASPAASDLEELSDAAQAARYPGPEEAAYDRTTAQRLVNAAAEIFSVVRDRLTEAGLDVSSIEPA
jgi:HEPN domain-containing protein